MISKRNIKNFLVLSLAEIASNLFAFVAIIYLARTLGVEGLGKVTFARAIILYFLIAVDAGLDLYAIRTAARDKQVIKGLIDNIISLRLVLAFVVYGLLVIFILFLPRDMEIKQLILCYGGMLFVNAFLLEWTFNATEKMEYSAMARFSSEVLFFLMAMFLISSPKQMIWVPFSRIFGSTIQVLFLFLLCWKFYGKIRMSIKFESWKSMLAKSLPMGYGFIMVQVYYNVDSIMLGFMKTDTQVGLYTVAYKLLTALALVGEVFQKSIYPSLSRFFGDSKSKMDQLLGQSLKVAVIFSIPIIVTGVIAASPFINLVYGPRYQESSLIFQILIFNVIFIWINGLVANAVLASDKEKKYFIGVTLGALSNFVLNLIFIPKWSMIGAAASTILSEVVVLTYFYFAYLINSEIKFIKRIYYILLYVIIPGLLTVFLKNIFSPFYLLAILYLIYLTALILFKIIDLENTITYFKKLIK